MTKLTAKSVDESTYVITMTFADADETAVTPNALTWSLTDKDGNIINSREDTVLTPAAEVFVVLQDDDLDYSDGEDRVFTIEGNYNSSTYGNTLPIREQASFKIKPWTDVIPGA